MKILSGKFKNQSVSISQKFVYRPTTSIVRKSLFDALKSLEGRNFLDLYAGSGMIGFEASSRGADNVTFIEMNKQHMIQIRNSAESIPYSNFNFLVRDSIRFLKKCDKYDIIFMRDHLLCNSDKKIVMCNMRLEERLNEGNFVVETMEKSGYIISYLPHQDCLAEGGEFFYLPKENILLAGLCRNNLKGAESMAELMGVDQLHIIESSGYHLDTAICHIVDNEYDCIGINCAKEVFNNKNYDVLSHLSKVYN